MISKTSVEVLKCDSAVTAKDCMNFMKYSAREEVPSFFAHRMREPLNQVPLGKRAHILFHCVRLMFAENLHLPKDQNTAPILAV